MRAEQQLCQLVFFILIGDIEQSSCPVIYPARDSRPPFNVLLEPHSEKEVKENGSLGFSDCQMKVSPYAAF